MNYAYQVIADEDTVLGFRCAGIPGVAVSSSEEALDALRTAKEKRVGIVIMTEEVAGMVHEEVDELRFGEALPMVVEVPGVQGPISGRRSLSEIIREAIGVKV